MQSALAILLLLGGDVLGIDLEVIVGLAATLALDQLLLDGLADGGEDLPDVVVVLRTALHKFNSVFLGQRTPLREGHLPLVLLAVHLVPHDDLAHRLRLRLVNLPNPVLQVLEALLVGDGVHEYDSGRALIVRLSYGLESFLARGVPDLHLNLDSIDIDGLDLKVHPNGSDVRHLVLLVHVTQEDIGLAHSSVPDYHQLHQVVVPLLVSPLRHYLIINKGIQTHRNNGEGRGGEVGIIMVVYNKKQQQKSMSIFNDTNNSINEILEILKNYRTEGKNKESLFHDTSQTVNHDDSSFNISNSNRPRDTSETKLRLHSSLENISKHKKAPSTIRSKDNTPHDSEGNIFSRLYEEDKALRERREKLFLNGRKRNQDQETKQCTFSPNLKIKTEKCINQEEIESFYQKNIDWQNKVDKEIKIKQCEKINEGINQLTFAPKINAFKKREKLNKENTQTVADKKGVEQFLQRQTKAKNCIQTLESRKKNAYGQMWNLKKCQFSYLH